VRTWNYSRVVDELKKRGWTTGAVRGGIIPARTSRNKKIGQSSAPGLRHDIIDFVKKHEKNGAAARDR
jgi:hypothetical protein